MCGVRQFQPNALMNIPGDSSLAGGPAVALETAMTVVLMAAARVSQSSFLLALDA